MVRQPSPGPQWAAFNESANSPSTQASVSEEELENYIDQLDDAPRTKVTSASRKRKVDGSVLSSPSEPAQKRAKVARLGDAAQVEKLPQGLGTAKGDLNPHSVGPSSSQLIPSRKPSVSSTAPLPLPKPRIDTNNSQNATPSSTSSTHSPQRHRPSSNSPTQHQSASSPTAAMSSRMRAPRTSADGLSSARTKVVRRTGKEKRRQRSSSSNSATPPVSVVPTFSLKQTGKFPSLSASVTAGRDEQQRGDRGSSAKMPLKEARRLQRKPGPQDTVPGANLLSTGVPTKQGKRDQVKETNRRVSQPISRDVIELSSDDGDGPSISTRSAPIEGPRASQPKSPEIIELSSDEDVSALAKLAGPSTIRSHPKQKTNPVTRPTPKTRQSLPNPRTTIVPPETEVIVIDDSDDNEKQPVSAPTSPLSSASPEAFDAVIVDDGPGPVEKPVRSMSSPLALELGVDGEKGNGREGEHDVDMGLDDQSMRGRSLAPSAVGLDDKSMRDGSPAPSVVLDDKSLNDGSPALDVISKFSDDGVDAGVPEDEPVPDMERLPDVTKFRDSASHEQADDVDVDDQVKDIPPHDIVVCPDPQVALDSSKAIDDSGEVFDTGLAGLTSELPVAKEVLDNDSATTLTRNVEPVVGTLSTMAGSTVNADRSPREMGSSSVNSPIAAQINTAEQTITTTAAAAVTPAPAPVLLAAAELPSTSRTDSPPAAVGEEGRGNDDVVDMRGLEHALGIKIPPKESPLRTPEHSLVSVPRIKSSASPRLPSRAQNRNGIPSSSSCAPRSPRPQRRPSVGQPGSSLAEAIIQAGQHNTKATNAFPFRRRSSASENEVIDLTADDGYNNIIGSRESSVREAKMSADMLSGLLSGMDVSPSHGRKKNLEESVSGIGDGKDSSSRSRVSVSPTDEASRVSFGASSPASPVRDSQELVSAQPKLLSGGSLPSEDSSHLSQDIVPAEGPTPSQKKSASLEEIRAIRKRQLAKAAQSQSSLSPNIAPKLPSSLEGSPFSSTPSSSLVPSLGPSTPAQEKDILPVSTEVNASRQNSPTSRRASTDSEILDGELDVLRDRLDDVPHTSIGEQVMHMHKTGHTEAQQVSGPAVEEESDYSLEYMDEPPPAADAALSEPDNMDTDWDMDTDSDASGQEALVPGSASSGRTGRKAGDMTSGDDDNDQLPKKAALTPPTSGMPSHFSLRPLSRRSSRSSTNSMNMLVDNDFDESITPPISLPHSHSGTPDDLPSITFVRNFAGIPVLTWRDFRRDLSNFTPKHYLAKDLPHALQDHINIMSSYSRSTLGMRTILETVIAENTADDEPDAPKIRIINNVDLEPTPPWEFYYTNKMWHGEGIPPPDVSRITSCDCMGRCDPKSKTCACLKRQQEYTSEYTSDFVYDHRGRLKVQYVPIFECNDLCGCSEECRNRVVQHGRKCMINIAKTEHKGWGVFAGPKKIYQGTFVGIYAGELLTDEVGEERGFKYNKFGRTYLFDLDFHHLKKGSKNWETMYVVDAYHAGNFTRFLNHSCDPNCHLNPCYVNESNIDKPLLTVFTLRDIEPGEELCFSYTGPSDDEDQPDDDTLRTSSPASMMSKVQNEAIYISCRCGAYNCTGAMFK